MNFTTFIDLLKKNRAIEGVDFDTCSEIFSGSIPGVVVVQSTTGVLLVKVDPTSHRQELSNKVFRCVGSYYEKVDNEKSKASTKSSISQGILCYRTKEALGIPNYIFNCAQCHQHCLSAVNSGEIRRVFNIKKKKK